MTVLTDVELFDPPYAGIVGTVARLYVEETLYAGYVEVSEGVELAVTGDVSTLEALLELSDVE